VEAGYDGILVRAGSPQPTDLPDFFSGTVRVPLLTGTNEIIVSVQGKTTALPEVKRIYVTRNSRGSRINAIFVSNGSGAGGPFERPATVEVLTNLRTALVGSTDAKRPNTVVELSGNGAREQGILSAVNGLLDHAAADDTNIIYLVGQASIFDDRVYFNAPNANNSTFWVSSIPIQKIAAYSGNITGVIDVCTSREELGNVKIHLRGELPPHWIAAAYVCNDASDGPKLGPAMVPIFEHASPGISKGGESAQWLLGPLSQNPAAIFSGVTASGRIE
jgi:hypothetical protein